MQRRGFIGGLLAGSAALLSGCGSSGYGSYRFKMTVEVETPRGLRTGASVYEAEGIGNIDLLSGARRSSITLRGEALPVDLPNGRTLFAMLRIAQNPDVANNLTAMSMRTMDPALDRHKQDLSADRIASGEGIRSPAQVAPEDFPTLVTFRDIDDPKTIEVVDPANLAKSLGPGYKLRRVTVALTDEPMTLGIEKRFRWWNDYKERYFNGKSTISQDMLDPSPAAQFASRDFSTEYNRESRRSLVELLFTTEMPNPFQ